ncbi:MAG: hypothetical protein EZS28_032456, partial [Streblomastix strix]
SIHVLVYVVIGCSAVQLLMVLINSLPWTNDVVRATTQSQKFIQLLPSDESESDGEHGVEKEMVLIPSMMTGYSPLDTGRQRILEAGIQLIDAIKDKETLQTISLSYQQLVNATFKQFQDEERDMLNREYRGSKNVTQEKILESGSGGRGNKGLSHNKSRMHYDINNINEHDNEIDNDVEDHNDQNYLEEITCTNDQALKFAINPNSDPHQYNYRTHAREHLIIKQRLTILGDQLHVHTDGGASRMIARRNIIRLYDVHFSNADHAYAAVIPDSEKTQVDIVTKNN